MEDDTVHSTSLSNNDEDFELMHQADVNNHSIPDHSDLGKTDNDLPLSADQPASDIFGPPGDCSPSKVVQPVEPLFPDDSSPAAGSSPDDFEVMYKSDGMIGGSDDVAERTDLDQPDDEEPPAGVEQEYHQMGGKVEEKEEPFFSHVQQPEPEPEEEPEVEELVEESREEVQESAPPRQSSPEEIIPPVKRPSIPLTPSPPSSPEKKQPEEALIDYDVGSQAIDKSGDEIPAAISSLLNNVDPRALEMLYWRRPIRSGMILAGLLSLELGLVFCSVISVIAYSSLLILLFTASLRVYSHFFKKADDSFIFKNFLETDISISRDQTEQVTRRICDKINAWVLCSRDLFLISNYFDSFKFAALLYLMTYIGARFNFLTLCILATVSMFTLPKIYETYQAQLDQLWDLLKGKIADLMSQVRSKIETLPVVGKKAKTN